MGVSSKKITGDNSKKIIGVNSKKITGKGYKDKLLQNTRALLEFRQMALQVHLERINASFGTTFVP